MKRVALSRVHALEPDNSWGKSLSDLLIDASEPVIAGLDIDGVFCASADASGGQYDAAALVADRLGLRCETALSFGGADVAGAAALFAAWQQVRAGICRTVLVVAAAKVSDSSENERLALMDRTLDPDADLARGINFSAQAGLLAGQYCRARNCDSSVFAETTAANYAAWSAHAKRPMPTAAELRRDLVVAPPLVRSDFAQLLDGACAVVLTSAEERAHPAITAMSAAGDVISVWERKDPLAFAAVEAAASRLPESDLAPARLEIDAGVSVVQRLAEDAFRRRAGKADFSLNSRGGAFGRGRAFGASALYQLADIQEIALPGESVTLLAVSGLGSHVFAIGVAGSQ